MFLDAGDFLSTRSSINDDEIVSAVYPEMGYDACAIGDQELINGIGFFKSKLNGRIRFVSSNLEFTDKTIIVDKYRIIETPNGVKVGVTAVNYNTNFKNLMRIGTIKEDDISVALAFDNLKQVLSELKNKCDITVVIAQLNNEGTIKLLDNVEGYDLVIAGNSPEEFRYARKVENKIHVQSGKDGEKIGKVIYNISVGKQPEFIGYELIKVLSRKYARNKKIDAIIVELEK